MRDIAAYLAQIKGGRFRYNSPWTQVFLVGFVCFCSVGMSSAIQNLGAGGIDDIVLSDTANGVLYGLFALTGLFISGPINNILGPRLTLSIGTCGYAIYTGSLWAYQTQKSRGFVIAAGAILGFTAALLWSAQGAIMMAYPNEKDKGRAFSLFWSVFNMGAVVGACIALGIEMRFKHMSAVSTGVYLVFVIIMLTAIFTSWLVLPPNLVVRSDGTVAELQPVLPMREELSHFFNLFRDWRMLMLFPMFFTSNYFYAYQGSIIAHMFNAPTRALASLVTNVGAVLGALVIGFVLDLSPGSRRQRAIVAWCVVLFLQLLVWSGGVAWQVQFKRDGPNMMMDMTDRKAIGPLFLLLGYYIADACYQGLAYYIMSSLTNDTFRLARMTGFYKGIQSAGAAISFGMDAIQTAYLTELIVSWAMILFTLPFAFVVIWQIKPTSYDSEETHHVEELDSAKIPGAGSALDVSLSRDDKVDVQHA